MIGKLMNMYEEKIIKTIDFILKYLQELKASNTKHDFYNRSIKMLESLKLDGNLDSVSLSSSISSISEIHLKDFSSFQNFFAKLFNSFNSSKLINNFRSIIEILLSFLEFSVSISLEKDNYVKKI